MNGIVLIGTIILIFIIKDKVSNWNEIRRKKIILEQQLLFKNTLDSWMLVNDNLYSNTKGYPKDWRIRRQLVLLRENFKCQNCNMEQPYRFVSTENDLIRDLLTDNYPVHRNHYGYISPYFHIHHIKMIKDGGNHEMGNLKLLCVDCHTNEPGHEEMRRDMHAKIYLKSYGRKKNKMKISRVNHLCEICEAAILPSEQYFGSKSRYYDKSCICLKCYQKYEKVN